MLTEFFTRPVRKGVWTRAEIEVRVQDCPRLPSLRSVDSALREMLDADERYTEQISEVIRRDPSLTVRLLRVVNSSYYSLSSPVNSIEEAVFYLGVRQIRQLAMLTPVIEDFQKLTGRTPFAWREFWRHCIGVAILTREVTSAAHCPDDEAAYVAGLLHDVGKLAMAASFPAHFVEIQRRVGVGVGVGAPDLLAVETEVLGLSHPELGAIYLQHHNLPEVIIESVQFHHAPEQASRNAPIVAAVQIADLMVRHAKIGQSGNSAEVTAEMWLNASGWDILFPNGDAARKAVAQAALGRSLERLPLILEGLV